MDSKAYLDIARGVLGGDRTDIKTLTALAKTPDEQVFQLLAGSDLIRDFYFGRDVHLCTICNAKSGRCPEDCAFCAQSTFAKSQVPVYPLLGKQKLQEGALEAAKAGIKRYSIVTSGKRLSRNEVVRIADAIEGFPQVPLQYCASLGILGREDFELLGKAGITRYHHNLETSESFFNKICSTHTYQERLETIRAAKEAGLSVCAGGLFGMGEKDEHVLELALAIRDLDVNSVPLNFLTPIQGTKLEHFRALTPLRCLKIIALFRYVLPTKDILICGGREANLKELHPLIFYAGANGIMTGNYLTTKGRTHQQDLDTIEQLQFAVRQKS
jgi:biotin synthase